MTQGGSPGRLLHLSGCGGLFFLCPEEAPGGAGDDLQHIAAKLRTLSKNFVIFPSCKMGGGGYNKKCKNHKKRKKERRPLP